MDTGEFDKVLNEGAMTKGPYRYKQKVYSESTRICNDDDDRAIIAILICRFAAAARAVELTQR